MSVQIRNPELVRLLAAEFVRRREVAVAAGKTLTVQHSLTLAGADGRTLTIPDTGTAALLATAQTFTAAQTISGAAARNSELLSIVGTGAGGGAANVEKGVTINIPKGANEGRLLHVLEGANSIFCVLQSGKIAIGATTAAGKLAVDQLSSTAAIPVLILDQGDVDQDFVEFVGGSSTGNATSISTDAAGAYAGRIQITVNGTRRWLNFYADA